MNKLTDVGHEVAVPYLLVSTPEVSAAIFELMEGIADLSSRSGTVSGRTAGRRAS